MGWLQLLDQHHWCLGLVNTQIIMTAGLACGHVESSETKKKVLAPTFDTTRSYGKTFHFTYFMQLKELLFPSPAFTTAARHVIFSYNHTSYTNEDMAQLKKQNNNLFSLYKCQTKCLHNPIPNTMKGGQWHVSSFLLLMPLSDVQPFSHCLLHLKQWPAWHTM